MPTVGFDVNFKTGTAEHFAEITPDANSFYCITDEDTDEVSLYIGANKIGSTFFTKSPWKELPDDNGYLWHNENNTPTYNIGGNEGIVWWWSWIKDYQGEGAYAYFTFGNDQNLGAGETLLCFGNDSGNLDLYRFNAHEFRLELDGQLSTDTKTKTLLTITGADSFSYHTATNGWSRRIPYFFGTAYMNGESIFSDWSFHVTNNPTTFDPNLLTDYMQPSTTFSNNKPNYRGEFIVRYYDLFKVLEKLEYTATYISDNHNYISGFITRTGATHAVVLYTGTSAAIIPWKSGTITLQPNTLYDVHWGEYHTQDTFTAVYTFATPTYVDTAIANAITNAIGGAY